MIRAFDSKMVNSCVALEIVAVACVLTTALLLTTTALENPASAGAAALVLALCGLIARFSRCALLSDHGIATQLPKWTDPHLGRTADITSPPQHPLRPRAPGLALALA
jgi:hypothetical protein